MSFVWGVAYSAGLRASFSALIILNGPTQHIQAFPWIVMLFAPMA